MSKLSIMVVDDDHQILRLMKVNLEKRGFHVTEAVDGESALELCKQMVPDIILLDITLPGLNGLQVCIRIREWSDVPIIMISANAGGDIQSTVLNCGANEYISKPFQIDHLLDRIQTLLRFNRGEHENT